MKRLQVSSCMLAHARAVSFFVLIVFMLSASAFSQQAPGHGPQIWLGERQSPPVTHVVANSTVNTVVAGSLGQPVSMTTGDVDEDGVNDLVVGYASGQGDGSIVIHRGNVDAFAPQSEASFQAIGRGEFPSPFLAEAQTIPVPLSPDFIALGNFIGNGHSDLVVAAKGGTALYVLSGDGQGHFSDPQILSLPGGITTLAAGSFGNPRQFGTLLVGMLSPQNVSSLTIFRGTHKGLASRASFPLTAPATSIAFGDLDGDGVSDAAILAGGQVSVLHSSSLLVEPVQVPVTATAMALGSFLPDRIPGRQIALLASDGSVQIVAHNDFDPRSFSLDELKAARQATMHGQPSPLMPVQVGNASGWKIVESIPSAAPFSAGQVPVFFSTRISSNAGDDLMALNAFTGEMSLISHADPAPGDATFHPAQVVTRPYTGSPLLALPMRINIDGRPGIVVLHKGEELPSFMMPLPDPTFFVNRNDDPVPGATGSTCNNTSNADTSTSCSLREAVLKANATAGTDTILLAAGTYTLSQPRVASNFTGQHGTLEVTDSVNIVGAGQNTTIIQGGTNATTSVDKVFSFNQDIAAFTNATVSVSNLTIQFGHNRGNTGIQDGWGGAFDFDTGGTTAGTGNATLSLSNVTLQSNSLTDGEGGGFAIFNTNSGTGNATVSNSIIQNNSATRSSANAAGNGGGIFVAFPAALTLNNSQVLNNTATQVNGTGTGVGGGIFIIGGSTHTQTTIHGGTISGNAASGDGGGIWSDAGTTIDQQTVISGNTAGNNGGGIWYNGAAANTASFSKLTITGNTAGVNGGGIHAGNPSLGPTLSMSFSRLAGNTAPSGSNLENAGSTATVTDNWWGTNSAANTIHTSAGTTVFDPFITLTNTPSPAILSIGPPNPSATVTASFIQDNHGTAIPVANLNVLIGLPAPASIFPGTPTLGTLSNVQTSIQANGHATETFTATAAGVETINAVVDQATVPANITVLAPPTISKAFGAATIPVNGTTTLTFTVDNPQPNTLAIHGIAFSDTFPTGLSVAATPGVVNTCGGTFTAGAGATTVSLSGGTVNPGTSPNPGTCTVTVNITGSPDGVRNNLSGAVSSTDAGTQNSTASASITVINPPAITKAFGAASIPLSGTTTLTFNLQSTNANLTLNGVAFTDSLPAGLVVAPTPNLSNTCGGAATAVAGASSVSLTGVTLIPGASCTVSVAVQGTAAGVLNNSVAASSTNGGTGNTSNASITVVAPPVISKTFGALSIPLNGSTSLSFKIQNSNTTTTLTGVGFSDTLPAGLVISTPNGQSGTCGTGTITAAAGTNVISLSGGTIAANTSCTFSVNVTGITAGLQNNTTSSVTSTEGGTGGTASASLKVEAPPSIAKAFNPTTIAHNATTSLTFTITNPAANVDPLAGVAFTDTLPTGLTVATASSTVCGGTLTTTAPTGIALTGATIAVNSQCQFSVTVTGATSGQYTNTTGSVTSTNGGTGNTASANLTVASPPSITKAFGAASIPLNGTTSLTFTIQNPNAGLALNGITFTDTLPGGLVVATPNALTNSCGGTATAVAGSSSVSLSAGTIASGASCTVTVNVTGVVAGVQNNSVSVSSTEGGAGNTSNASVTVVGPPVISKTFGAASIPLNGSTSLSFKIQNSNTTTTLTGVGFSDTLPAGLVISTPNGQTGTCGGGTITATAGTNTISLSGASLAASASCTFSVNVTGITAGLQNNTTGNVTSTEGGTGGTASASIKVEAPPVIAKAFNPTNISKNATTSLTFTITNPAANVDPLAGVAFTDTLPTGLTIASSSATVCGGTLTTTAPTGIALTGATIAVNSQCQFSVTVTGAASGQFTNTTGNVTSTNGGTGNTASANLTVASPPSITKTFGAASIALNGTTSLTFTIQNPNTNVTLNGVAFTDSLPPGLVVDTPSALTNSCGGTATATAGSSSVSLSAGTLAASASCTVSLNVQGTTAGPKNNSVSVTSTEGGTGNTSNATVTVVSPAVISKTFGAASIPLNGSTSLSFTIQNSNTTTALTGVGFTDTLPAGLVISTPNGQTSTCGGTITATAGTNTISLSGGTIAANASCTLSVNVTGITAGLQNNTTSNVTSTEGGTGGTASASIKVEAPPTIAKVFNPTSIALNATTSLTFTITNPAANVDPLAGVAFTDTLPTGLTVANASATVCGGTLTTTAPGTISLTGATIAVNNQCQFSVTVTGTASGQFTNTTGNVTSTNGGTGNTASANLTVATPPTITKVFGAASIPLDGTTSLTFTITNPAANVISLTGIGFTDSLPAGLVVASPNGLTNTCGGTATAAAGSSSVSLSAVTLAPGASCTVSLNVQGTIAGVKNNSVTVTSTEGGNGNTSNASVTVVSPAVISKTFGAASIPLNGSTSLSFTLQNSNTTTTLTGVGFTDTLPAGLIISIPNGQTGTCGGGTITATAGTNTISLSGANLAASASCTFSVNVTGIGAGLQNNTTGNVTSTEGGTGGTASASIKVEAPPTIAKVFNPTSIALNATTSLTFTITNPAANVDPLSGVAFTDTLPTGLTVANASATVCGGTLTTTAPGTISLTGATIAVNNQCQFSVTVTGTASGQFTNTTGNVTSTNGGTGNTASANLTVATPPTITKAFGAAAIPLNGTTSLTFTITNPAANVISLTGISFTDSLPSGLVVATPNGLTNTCGGTATAAAGSSSVSLSAVTLAPGASCTVAANVQGVAPGVQNNSVSVTSTEGGAGNTSNASITVVSPALIIKSFGATSIPLNGSTSLSFIVQNPNTTTTLTGIGFSDTLPAGLVISTPNGQTGTCGGGTISATAGTNTISLSGASLAASTSCTFSVNVTGIAAGTQNNTTGNVTSTEGGTGGTASASIAVIAPPTIAKVFSPANIPLNGTTSLTFTITNPAANTVALTGVAFTDTLPTGLTVATASATVCGGTLTTTAPTGIALSGATIAVNSQCQFSVTVTGAVSGQYTNTTGNVTSANGGTGNTASANLSVATAPTITKTFGAVAIPLNGTTSLSFSINNPNTSISLTGIAFSDVLPAGLVVGTPNGLTGSCGGGTITATAGSSSVSLSGATLAASASCTFSVTVTGIAAGVQSNTTGPISSNESGPGLTSNTAVITVVGPPSITKTFGAASISLNQTTSLSFTITNANSTVALTGVAFTDSLPLGIAVTTPNGLTGSCGAGTISNGTAGGHSVITLTGGTIAANSSCTFSMNIVGLAGGTQVNTTSNVTSTEGGTGNSATATITVLAQDLAITKTHAGNFSRGQTGATYTITVSNIGNGPTIGTVSVTDTLPNVNNTLVATAISGTGWTCDLPSLTCTRSDALAPGASYPAITLTVNVPQNIRANVTNTATVSGGGETNTSNNTATDPTHIGAPLQIEPENVSSLTVLKGGSGSINFQVDTVGAAPLPFITFGCTGLPVGTTCTFNPPTENQLSSVVTMTVKTTGKNSASMPLSGPGEKPRSFYAALLLPLMGPAGIQPQRTPSQAGSCAAGLVCGWIAGPAGLCRLRRAGWRPGNHHRWNLPGDSHGCYRHRPGEHDNKSHSAVE